MMGAAKDVIEGHTRSWNEHDCDRWTDDFADDVELKIPGDVSGVGRETASRLYAVWQDSFPDCQIDPVLISEDGENVTVEAVFKGSHIRPLNALSGTIPATGKAVAIPFVATFKVMDGKIMCAHLYFDQAELMKQLGLAVTVQVGWGGRG